MESMPIISVATNLTVSEAKFLQKNNMFKILNLPDEWN